MDTLPGIGAQNRLLSRAGQLKQRLRLRTRADYFVKNARWLVPWTLKQKFIKSRFGIEPILNYILDHKYGGYCGGKFQTPFLSSGAHGTSSADYSQLRRLFCAQNGLEIGPDDVLVDVGCGRGRVLNFWLGLGLGNRITGIELDERFASEAAARLAPYPNVTVIAGDALDHLPPDATVLHLFNPFDESVMTRFKERVFQLYAHRGITIAYQYCRHADVFYTDPRWTVEPVRIKTFYPSVIVRLRPGRDA